jgi:hypothetical protein
LCGFGICNRLCNQASSVCDDPHQAL